MLTISLGVVIHVLRVIFGDDFAMQYVVTPTTDKVLLVPMAYAAITGIVLWHAIACGSRTSAPGVLHVVRRVHRRQRAASHLLQLHHLGHHSDDVVSDVVQLVSLDRGVPGVPDAVRQAAI